MAKRSKLPTDVNSRAKAIVDFATSDEEEPEPSPCARNSSKGGRKGGNARAEKLTPAERAEIARKAAPARWDRSPAE